MAIRFLFVLYIALLLQTQVFTKVTKTTWPKDQRKGASLKVIKPTSVSQQFENGHIQTTLLNLGQMHKGASLNSLIYVPPRENDHGCLPFPNQKNVQQHIVLVYGVDCPISTKVRNIQEAGGVMALIAHETFDINQEFHSQVIADFKYLDNAVMQIPSLLISKEDGQILADAFNKGETVRLRANFEVQEASSKVIEVTLWYGSFLDLSHKLIQELYDYIHLLQYHIVFTPRIITYECLNCVNETKSSSCFSDGQYCLIPPKQEIRKDFPTLTDKALLEQSLLERCIHEEIKKKGKEKDDIRFFNYLYNVRDECLDLGWRDLTIGCAERVMAELDIDVFSVAYCTQNSFEGHNAASYPDPQKLDNLQFDFKASENKLLREDRVQAELYGVSKHPAITINGHLYNGKMSGYEIYKAICNSFHPQNKPEECKESFDIQTELGHAMEDFKEPSNNKRFILFGVLSLVFGFNLMVWMCYRRYQTKKMQDLVKDQVQGSVNNYMQLRDTSVSKDNQL